MNRSLERKFNTPAQPVIDDGVKPGDLFRAEVRDRLGDPVGITAVYSIVEVTGDTAVVKELSPAAEAIKFTESATRYISDGKSHQAAKEIVYSPKRTLISLSGERFNQTQEVSVKELEHGLWGKWRIPAIESQGKVRLTEWGIHCKVAGERQA